MKPKRNWRDHPELVRLRERRNKTELLALVEEIKRESALQGERS